MDNDIHNNDYKNDNNDNKSDNDGNKSDNDGNGARMASDIYRSERRHKLRDYYLIIKRVYL